MRIEGNYNDSVAYAARLAKEHGWHVVSDTSYEGYEAIPRDVMQGYATIAAEIAEADVPSFTHVFLQGGGVGLAAGVASYLWEREGENRPCFIVVEPRQADCLYQNAIAGCVAKSAGSVDAIMAGLASGEASPLAQGIGDDVPVVAGESGAAGFAGLAVLMRDRELARKVGLDTGARVLVINTEGATAPSVYAQLVGESAESVSKRQCDWLQRVAG